MAVTLAQYVNAVATDDFVTDCAAEAEALVTQHIGTVTGVPDKIKARAVLEVGANLYQRRQAQSGTGGLTDPEVTPHRVARDPLRPAYPILNPYLGPGIG